MYEDRQFLVFIVKAIKVIRAKFNYKQKESNQATSITK